MKTDYTNCHPEIAESLKRGEHIRCKAAGRDDDRAVVLVTAYLGKERLYLSDKGEFWHTLEPIKTETYVIDAVSMMKGLVERRYNVLDDGTWVKLNYMSVTTDIWQHCDYRQPYNVPYDSWMLEKREI